MALLCSISLFLFFFIVASIAEVVDLRSASGRSYALAERSIPPTEYNRLPSHPPPDDDLDLLDIVLVASVDGKLHAFNRTSGHTLWSMSSGTSKPTPSALAPLVRTVHVDHDPELTDETTPQELYVIEPQSGDIYVMATPTSPLQRFPLSVNELVDLSPFTFPDHEDPREFVGRKETSLLLIELETGKIKSTLNSECAWDRGSDEALELDLDELEGSRSLMSTPTEIYIGRTGV
jgi:serine/threonine-protein kinase/endoribonuclease IRE1